MESALQTSGNVGHMKPLKEMVVGLRFRMQCFFLVMEHARITLLLPKHLVQAKEITKPSKGPLSFQRWGLRCALMWLQGEKPFAHQLSKEILTAALFPSEVKKVLSIRYSIKSLGPQTVDLTSCRQLSYLSRCHCIRTPFWARCFKKTRFKHALTRCRGAKELSNRRPGNRAVRK